MAQSLSDILLHIVFSTKDRRPWIDASIEQELFKYLVTACKTLIVLHMVSVARTITFTSRVRYRGW
ncbi:MAG: hypothetical protein SH868_18720 [Bythopirellula sp.]|nr:hypothetical protein [Bythopirellula sp.]